MNVTYGRVYLSSSRRYGIYRRGGGGIAAPYLPCMVLYTVLEGWRVGDRVVCSSGNRKVQRKSPPIVCADDVQQAG